MDIRTLGRAGAVALLAVAIAGAVVAAQNGRDEVAPAPVDALSLELARCKRLGLAAADDTACKALWASLRNAFLGSEEFVPVAEDVPDVSHGDAD